MLSGNDFIILSSSEAFLLYNAFARSKSKATYKELAELGVLNLIKEIEGFLFKESEA